MFYKNLRIDLQDERDIKFLVECREWKRLINTLEGDYKIQCYCMCHNWCTSPSALNTDIEHHIKSCLAKWCRKQLQNYSGWHETENGWYLMNIFRKVS